MAHQLNGFVTRPTGPFLLPLDALVAIELVAVDRHGVAETLQHDETRVVANTVSPKWNATFDFVVPEALVDDAMVVFKAWDTRGIGRAFLGQVRSLCVCVCVCVI